jgi:hypothetical protein
MAQQSRLSIRRTRMRFPDTDVVLVAARQAGPSASALVGPRGSPASGPQTVTGIRRSGRLAGFICDNEALLLYEAGTRRGGDSLRGSGGPLAATRLPKEGVMLADSVHGACSWHSAGPS